MFNGILALVFPLRDERLSRELTIYTAEDPSSLYLAVTTNGLLLIFMDLMRKMSFCFRSFGRAQHSSNTFFFVNGEHPSKLHIFMFTYQGFDGYLGYSSGEWTYSTIVNGGGHIPTIVNGGPYPAVISLFITS